MRSLHLITQDPARRFRRCISELSTKGGAFVLELPTTLAQRLYMCSFPHRFSGCFYMMAKWGPLSDLNCEVAETLGQEAGCRKHDMWQRSCQMHLCETAGRNSTEHGTKMLCFLGILFFFFFVEF